MAVAEVAGVVWLSSHSVFPREVKLQELSRCHLQSEPRHRETARRQASSAPSPSTVMMTTSGSCADSTGGKRRSCGEVDTLSESQGLLVKGGYVGITWRLRDLGWLHRARKRVEACQVGRTAGHLQHRPHSSSSHRAADALPRVGDHSLQPA